MPEGTRKGGLSEAKARKCPVDTFLARGRVHRRKTAPRKGYWLSSISPFAFGHPLFGFPPEGTRKAGSGTAGVKNSPVDCFSGRGRVPPFPDASRRDVDGNGEPLFPPFGHLLLLVYARRDSKGRPERSEGTKVSSGHFRSPSVSKKPLVGATIGRPQIL